MNWMKSSFLILVGIMVFSGCYSFRGISIAPQIKTFYVSDTKLKAAAAPGDLPEVFTEQLSEKIRSESPLKQNNRNPDIEFQPTITNFSYSTQAVSQNNQVALNKLTISVKIDFIDNINEDDSWTKSFSFSIPFDATADLNEIQDGLIEDIFDEITEQVFTEAFANW